MAATLVTFLGTGNYRPAYHSLDGAVTAEPHATAAGGLAALARDGHLPLPEKVVVLATKEAFEQNGSVIDRELGELLSLDSVEHRPIPTGVDEVERWAQFQAVANALREADGPVLLDVTHGFRTQPMLGVTALGYLRVTGRLPPDADVRLFYAAFEAAPRQPQPTTIPLWDLAVFSELFEWTAAVALFRLAGRGDLLARAIRGLSRRIREHDRAAANRVARLASSMEDLAHNLAANRAIALLHGPHSSAATVRRALEDVQGEDAVATYAPPVVPLLEELRAQVGPLVCDDLASGDGLRAQRALARLYWGFGRFLEAAAVLREAAVNAHAPPQAIRGAGDIRASRNSLDARAREAAERRWRQRAGDTASNIGNLRNDLEHCGFRPSWRKAPGIRDELASLIEGFDPVPSPAAAPPARPTFLNLSNHPSEEWTEEQRQAALALEPGLERIVDLPFPAVPPEADLDEVLGIAREVAATVPADVAVAMVMGEATLQHALVAELQARGVRCVAATTERDVEALDDGTIRRRFHFRRFRDLPGNP